MSFAIKRAAKSKLAVLSLLFGFVRGRGRGRVKERDAINIRNLFKFNFDFICFLSGAAVVFTFIRFASFWFCSFASENSKHPAKLLTSLLACRSLGPG